MGLGRRLGRGRDSLHAGTQAYGQYLIGAGIYNYDTALANQLNAQTAMQVNDYMAQVAHEAAYMHHARTHQEFLKDKSLYDAHIQALRDTPTPQQIENGDALNQAVRDLSDPRLSPSSLRAAEATVPAKLIADVPFESSTERVTIVLDKLGTAFKWPEVFEEDRFANDKKLFDDVVTRLRTEDEKGEISGKTLREARQMVTDLDTKITAQPSRTRMTRSRPGNSSTPSASCSGCSTSQTPARPSPSSRRCRTPRSATSSASCTCTTCVSRRRRAERRMAYDSLWHTLDETRDQVLTAAQIDLKKPLSAHLGVVTDFYGRIKPKNPSQNPPE